MFYIKPKESVAKLPLNHNRLLLFPLKYYGEIRMNKIFANNFRLFRNVRDVLSFLKKFHINPAYFIIAGFLSLISSVFEGLNAGLLMVLLKGIMLSDFKFITKTPIICNLYALFPAQSRYTTLYLLATLTSALIISVITKNIFAYNSATIINYQVRQLSHNMRISIFDRYLSMGKLYFDKSNPGHLHNVLMGFTQRIAAQLQFLYQFIGNAFNLFVYFIVMLLISWKLAVITLIFFPVLSFLLNILLARIKKISTSSVEHEKHLAHIVANTLSCIPLIKFYSQEHRESARFSETSSVLQNLEFSIDKKRFTAQPIQEIYLLIGVTFLSIIVGYKIALNKTADMAGFLIFFYMLKKCSFSYSMVNFAVSNIAMIGGVIKEVRSVFDDKDKYFVVGGSKEFPGLKRNITFKDLTFSYSQDVKALNHVNLIVNKGKMTAIVGPTGSGKTTLINLLLRFYDCPPSSIFIDDVDILDYSINSVSAEMAIVSQDTWLFDDTVKNNILYGFKEAIGNELIFDVLRKSRLSDFILKLPSGINTYVGDRGVKISGGEKQRIAIARAILRKPEILLLDEATSSLDTKTEKLIQEAIEEVTAGKTTIVIAHRLSTIKNADKIVVMDNGTIVEEGSLAELLTNKSVFRRYWEDQMFNK